MSEPKRIDREGRDVTDLPGLWDESDLYECGCGFTWHQKHESECANCECERLREDVQLLTTQRDYYLALADMYAPPAQRGE
jgi:hypothetical protein